jgi:hypothetical protein
MRSHYTTLPAPVAAVPKAKRAKVDSRYRIDTHTVAWRSIDIALRLDPLDIAVLCDCVVCEVMRGQPLFYIVCYSLHPSLSPSCSARAAAIFAWPWTLQWPITPKSESSAKSIEGCPRSGMSDV